MPFRSRVQDIMYSKAHSGKATSLFSGIDENLVSKIFIKNVSRAIIKKKKILRDSFALFSPAPRVKARKVYHSPHRSFLLLVFCFFPQVYHVWSGAYLLRCALPISGRKKTKFPLHWCDLKCFTRGFIPIVCFWPPALSLLS